jgi:iron complex outermembrane receptor protein
MLNLENLKALGAGQRGLLLGSVALAAMFAPHAVLAQAAAEDDAAAVEEVVVTGSSIRGVAPVGSALIGVTRDTIQAQAPANSKELLASVPQLGNFGVNAEQSTPDRFRTAGFQPNIHNLGIYATLTLLNGHRIAPVGGEAVFPDPSIVPVIAVQRVEVVADGASAVYGSDAVAGVVNFIYRKNVEGLEVSSTYGWNDTRYQKRDFAILGGHSWEGGNIMAAYQFSDNNSPLNTDIDFLALGGDQRSRGGRDLRGSNCLQPNVTANGTTYAYNNGAYSVGRNLCGLLDQGTVIPDSQRHALLVTGRQRVTDTVELWGEFNYSQYDTRSFGGQTSLNLIMPNTNPYFRAPAGSNATSIQVVRSALGLFPSRFSTQESNVYAFTGGADIDLGKDWRGNLMVHASKTADYNNDPEIDLVNAVAAINGTTLATALNPFGQAADNNATVLASIDNGYRRINDTSQRLRELQFKADGPLWTLPGGEVRAAVGVDVRNEQARQTQISGSPARKIIDVRDDNIGRTVTSGFYELNVPIVGDGNARPFMERLTLSVSGRYDYYEKYGGQFNPKYGVVWEPISGIALHGSYGTSFAAPNIGIITSKFGFLGSRDQNTVLTDWKTGQQIQRPFDIYNMGGGNPDLEPEEATSYSFGVDFTPDQVPGLRLSASYYNVEYRNTIYKASLNDVITNPAFEAYRTINPTPAQMAAVLAEAPPEMEVQPYVTWDVIFRSYAINLGMRQFEGIDLDGSYDFNTDFGHFTIAANANRKLVDRQQVLPGTPFNDRLGTDQAVKWKGRTSIAWNMDPATIGLAINYIGKYRYTNGSVFKNADAWVTYDLVANVKLDKLREGLSVQGRIVNLTNEDPPFTDNANGYIGSLASPFGRQFEVTVRAKF